MATKDVECPHCQKVFGFPLDELTQEDLAPLLKQAAGKEDHRHKSADEFADCPECRTWFDTTATKYKLSAKEPAQGDREPEPAAPAIGSIFKIGGSNP